MFSVVLHFPIPGMLVTSRVGKSNALKFDLYGSIMKFEIPGSFGNSGTNTPSNSLF